MSAWSRFRGWSRPVGSRALRGGSALASLALVAALLPATVLAEGTGAISGKVFDAAGVPAADVIVYACAGACTYVYSGADGTYSVAGLDPGNYRVGIEDLAGKLAGGYATATGLTVSSAAATLIPVAATPVPFDIHATAGHLISGTITAAAGGPIDNILVEACVIVAVAVDRNFLPCGADVTGADGTYSLTVLPGSYKVSAYDFGTSYATGYYSTGGYVFSSRNATPLAGGVTDVAGINLALPAGAALSGSVTGGDALPVADIEVVACLTPDLIGCGSTTTDADGSYSVHGLPAGSYHVWFTDATAGHPTGFYGPAGFTGQSGEASSVVIGATGASGIDVSLPTGHIISGVVTRGGQLAGIQVQDCTSLYCIAVATTGSDGSYRLNVASGKHAVHASDYSGANLSGYYSTGGLANQLHLTNLTVGSSDLAGINLKLHGIGAGVHAGNLHSGKFVASTAVRKATYATVRFTFGKPFAGTRVTVLRAAKSSSGRWSSDRTVSTVVVGSDGNAYYSAKISGTLRFTASVSDSVVRGVQVHSTPAYVRSK